MSTQELPMATALANRNQQCRKAIAAQTTLFTIGYQERSVLDFVRALRAAGVEMLVDVRAVPLSRRPDFRKNALRLLLEDAGISYTGITALGTPPELRDRLKADRNYDTFFSDFRKHMVRQRAALTDLIALASTTTCALLCYERDANKCHRSVVAAYVSGKLSCDVSDL